MALVALVTLGDHRYTPRWKMEDIHGANENSPRRTEIKVRKNAMKVRKNEIKSPKSFSVSHWKIKDFHEGIYDFLRRD